MSGVLLKPGAIDSETPLTEDRLSALPMFPLGNAVFFPWTLMPLHIFEPRYRAMTRFCIDNDWPLAIGSATLEEDEDGMGVKRVMGIGDIIHHDEFDDGRFHIVVRCLGRIEILDEIEEVDGFRRVSARLLEDKPILDPSALDATMMSIQGCINGLQGSMDPELVNAMRRWSQEAGSPEAVTFGLSSVLFHTAQERQGMLEEVSVQRRAEKILDQLTELMVRDLGDSSPETLN